MGRFLMYFVISALGIFVIASYGFLEHGGGAIQANRDTFGPEELWSIAPAYDGTRIVLEGELAYDETTDAYSVIEGERAIGVRGYEGDNPLVDLVGQRVRVTGKFHNEEKYITAESVIAIATPPVTGQ